MKVSVCIIAKNEQRITHTLESLSYQSLNPSEVLVVVDEPDDISARIAEGYFKKLPIRIVLNDIPGYGGARKEVR